MAKKRPPRGPGKGRRKRVVKELLGTAVKLGATEAKLVRAPSIVTASNGSEGRQRLAGGTWGSPRKDARALTARKIALGRVLARGERPSS